MNQMIPQPLLHPLKLASIISTPSYHKLMSHLDMQMEAQGPTKLSLSWILALMLTTMNLIPKFVMRGIYTTNSKNVSDSNGHGTWVASKIGGKKDDFGMHGVAYDADLAIFKIFPDDSSITIDMQTAWADAVAKSIDLHAIAINQSWVMSNPDNNNNEFLISDFDRTSLSSYLGSSIMNSLNDSDAAGLINVFAAGNDGQSQIAALAGLPVYFPEYADSVIGVVAVDANNEIADFSNRCGSALEFCIAAPGVDSAGAASSDATIIPGVPFGGNEYTLMSGTSMAAPVVSGAIAVLASNFPELTSGEILEILKTTATDLGDPGVDEIYGHGLLNLENAVAPQGQISVMTGNDISNGKIPLNETYIIGNGSIAASISSILNDQSIMVSDDYDRGYELGLSTMVISSDSASIINDEISAYINSVDQQLLNNSGFYILPNARQPNLRWVKSDAFTSPYAPLVDSHFMSHKSKFGSMSFQLTGSVDEQNSTYIALQTSRRAKNHTELSFEFGHLSEQSQMLGAEINGAFGSDLQTQTNFARFGTDFKISSQLGIITSASFGLSNFSSNGILSSGGGEETTSCHRLMDLDFTETQFSMKTTVLLLDFQNPSLLSQAK